MLPTLQNTRAQRNAALARSSSSTGYVGNVRFGGKADPREFSCGRSIDWIDARKQFRCSNAAKNFFHFSREELKCVPLRLTMNSR